MANQSDALGHLVAFASETLTVGLAASALTASVYTPADRATASRARRAVITANDQPIRLRYDGGTPTASNGHRVAAGEMVIVYTFGNIANVRLIREGATDSNVTITYER